MKNQFLAVSKSKFEWMLTDIRKRNNLGFWNDETDRFRSENPTNNIMEYIYAYTTFNKNVKILIFSSLDIGSKMFRPNGSDAVRLVYEVNSEKGYKYIPIKKIYRTSNILVNLENALINASQNCYRL